MFADPQTVTVNAVAKTLPRVGSPSPESRGVFKSTDGEFSLEIRQLSTKDRFRRELRLTQKKVAVDPLASTNKEVSASAIMTIDEPRWGFTDTELGYLSSALVALYTAAVRDKLLGGEL